jgi:hypothetical protein
MSTLHQSAQWQSTAHCVLALALPFFAQGCATAPVDNAATPVAVSAPALVVDTVKTTAVPIAAVTPSVAVSDAALDARANFHYLPQSNPPPALVNARSTFRMPATSSVWSRMDEFRSHDNVQVLTLWQSRRFMFSLQSGKHGETALRWGSKSLNRGEAKRGLLDRMFHEGEAQ